MFFWPESSPFHSCLLMLHVKTVVYLQQIRLIQDRGFLKKALVKKSKYFLFCSVFAFLLWFWLWHIMGRSWSFVVCCTLSLFCFLFLSLCFSHALSVTVSVLCVFPLMRSQHWQREGSLSGRSLSQMRRGTSLNEWVCMEWSHCHSSPLHPS